MKTPSQALKTIEEIRKDIEFLPTGLKDFDKELDGGLLRKEIVILGGFTGIGKSYLAGQIMLNIALKGFRTGYFSLEIANEVVISRLIGQEANIKSAHILTNQVSTIDQMRMDKEALKITSHDEFIHLYDEVYELADIKAKIRAGKYEFVVIDFIQNIMVKGMNDEYSRLSHVALELQRLAKEVDCCILVLSQLSNFNEKAGKLEYKGSGSVAMVADIGLFILRGDADLGSQNDLTLVLKKNRRGVSGLSFSYQFQTPGGKII